MDIFGTLHLDAGLSADQARIGRVAIPQQLHSNPDSRPLQGKRVGWYKQWFQDADLPVVSACTSALHLLGQLGAEVGFLAAWDIPDICCAGYPVCIAMLPCFGH